MRTKTTFIAAIVSIASCSFAVANEKEKEAEKNALVNSPTSIAPVFGHAQVRTAKERRLNKMGAAFEVIVNVPEVNWKSVRHEQRAGKVLIWREIKTETKFHELTLDFNSSSQIPESTITRLDGTRLTQEQIKTELAKSKRVLCSLNGKSVDPYYKNFFAPETLVIILARDEGMGEERLISKASKKE